MKRYWKMIVLEFTERTPKIQEIPRIGASTATLRTPALFIEEEKRRGQYFQRYSRSYIFYHMAIFYMIHITVLKLM